MAFAREIHRRKYHAHSRCLPSCLGPARFADVQCWLYMSRATSSMSKSRLTVMSTIKDTDTHLVVLLLTTAGPDRWHDIYIVVRVALARLDSSWLGVGHRINLTSNLHPFVAGGPGPGCSGHRRTRVQFRGMQYGLMSLRTTFEDMEGNTILRKSIATPRCPRGSFPGAQTQRKTYMIRRKDLPA